MGIISKTQELNPAPKRIELTDKEINFILAKLRTATFLGEEFEQFYNIWVKLTEMKSVKPAPIKDK